MDPGRGGLHRAPAKGRHFAKYIRGRSGQCGVYTATLGKEFRDCRARRWSAVVRPQAREEWKNGKLDNGSGCCCCALGDIFNEFRAAGLCTSSWTSAGAIVEILIYGTCVVILEVWI